MQEKKNVRQKKYKSNLDFPKLLLNFLYLYLFRLRFNLKCTVCQITDNGSKWTSMYNQNCTNYANYNFNSILFYAMFHFIAPLFHFFLVKFLTYFQQLILSLFQHLYLCSVRTSCLHSCIYLSWCYRSYDRCVS